MARNSSSIEGVEAGEAPSQSVGTYPGRRKQRYWTCDRLEHQKKLEERLQAEKRRAAEVQVETIKNMGLARIAYFHCSGFDLVERRCCLRWPVLLNQLANNRQHLASVIHSFRNRQDVSREN